MEPARWEVISWIATSLASLLTILGLAIIIVQLHLQRKETRLRALDLLFQELDSHEARLARRFIYNAHPDLLRATTLDQVANEQALKHVEDTLAKCERLAYKIATRQVPESDAFILYGGVILSVMANLWPYVEDQRAIRAANPPLRHRQYASYLERLTRKWVRRHCRKVGIAPPTRDSGTKAMLDHVSVSGAATQTASLERAANGSRGPLGPA